MSLIVFLMLLSSCLIPHVDVLIKNVSHLVYFVIVKTLLQVNLCIVIIMAVNELRYY